MKKYLFISCLLVLMMGLALPASLALANKSAVRIEAPASAAIGEEITITLHVTHDGNNFMHHTDWLYVQINGQEIQRWTFGRLSKPESGSFTRTLQFKVIGPVEIKAEAHCNIHGSAGIAQKSLVVNAIK